MRRILNLLLDSLSTLLLVFGAGLLLIGLAVHLSRVQAMREISHASEMVPSFEDTVNPSGEGVAGRIVAPALSTEPVQGASDASPPARIVIPKIHVDSPVVEVGVEARIVNGEREGNIWQTADYAAGHHMYSSYPGESGNVVISGHNNVRGSVFRDLYKLTPGDVVTIYDVDGREFPYVVAESFVVPEENATPEERRNNAAWIRQTLDERVTLVSCFPPWSNTHRSIVVGFPAPPSTSDADLDAAAQDGSAVEAADVLSGDPAVAPGQGGTP